ncbi:MAG: hypothetical protein SV186_03360 [Candidatus Nanohaloarchaea archaeon]|nr:hypothetical protein [Candidatus Nanohaloarchaea archaeon]
MTLLQRAAAAYESLSLRVHGLVSEMLQSPFLPLLTKLSLEFTARPILEMNGKLAARVRSRLRDTSEF